MDSGGSGLGVHHGGERQTKGDQGRYPSACDISMKTGNQIAKKEQRTNARATDYS